MYTLVLSGPNDKRAQVVSVLKQVGAQVEESIVNVKSSNGPVALKDYDHELDSNDGDSFITAQTEFDDTSGESPAVKAVEPFGWVPRMHWETVGKWSNRKSEQVNELEELKAKLRAAGIDV